MTPMWGNRTSSWILGALGGFSILGAVGLATAAPAGAAPADCTASSTGVSGTCTLYTPNGTFNQGGSVSYTYDASSHQLTITVSGTGPISAGPWLCIGAADMSGSLLLPANQCTPNGPLATGSGQSLVNPVSSSGDTFVFDVPSGDFWFMHVGADGNTLEAAAAAAVSAPVSNPGSNDPGSNNPGSNNPGSNDPGSSNPGSNNPGSSNPGSSDPGSNNPGSNDPGSSDPGSNNPGSNNPGSNDPGSSNPGSNNPGSNDPGSTGPSDPGSSQPSAASVNSDTSNTAVSDPSTVPAATAPLSLLDATTVHTGEPFAGSKPFEVAMAAFGMMLLALGGIIRRRARAQAAEVPAR